ncbi:MAG: preprotein translocase subunit SecY, partial [Kiritimatiellaeota bacterium]|nr:preprotein translocase subunit SecY [Kiritimatiellota bacterium]
IWPYITTSIVIQLLTPLIPSLERMSKEGEVGRQKLNQLTRYIALGFCAVQAFALAQSLQTGFFGATERLVMIPGVQFIITTVLSVTAASMLTMWLGEQITERGVGQGASIIIMINICSRLPSAIYDTAQKFISTENTHAELTIFNLAFMLVIAFLVFAGTIAVTQALRRIPIHTARRSVGANRVTGGTDTYLPLRLNFAGVMPIILARPILGVIGMILALPKVSWLSWLAQFGENLKSPTHPTHLIAFGVLIVFFSFFWLGTQFHAVQMADDLKASNGYIPGIRPGMPTAEFLDMTMTRVTVIGALALVIIAVLPTVLSNWMRIPGNIADFFGGTSLLIIVGVALDSLRQVESYLVMRNYDGFLKHGHIRGRRG